MKNFDKIEFYVQNIGQTNRLHGIEESWPFELSVYEHIQMSYFLQVISAIETKKPTMIELGHSSHSAYSQTFNSIFDGECINVCIEPIEKHVILAQQEWTSGGLKGSFYHGYAGAEKPTNGGEKFRVKDLMLKHDIDVLDILHMDIDGQEACVLSEIAEDGIFDRIHNLFVSTHNDMTPFVDLHSDCNKILRDNAKDHNYLFDDPHRGGQSDGCIIVSKGIK